MERKCVKKEAFLADESPSGFIDNYEKPKHEFVTEIDDSVFEIKKCLQ